MPGAVGGRHAAAAAAATAQEEWGPWREKKPAGQEGADHRHGHCPVALTVPPSSLDRVVFESQECELSCVLEGSGAWL